MSENSVKIRDLSSSKMVDDVKNITESAESKVQTAEALDRARLARERREAEQRKRLEELRAHAAAAQAQREKRDEERRRRQAEQRARDDDRRVQVEERKRAIWEASVSRREALLQREREREERLERSRSNRSVVQRSAFAFGSSTPRLLEPVDTSFFWGGRSTNPSENFGFFDALATSTTNVMFASAPLTRRASALQLDLSDGDNNKDDPERSPQQQHQAAWSSVARRRTDLVPTAPSRGPGRAHSMSRLDLASRHDVRHDTAVRRNLELSRHEVRSGDSTPVSRPGSAMSSSTSVVRRAVSAPRRVRPNSIAGTGFNTPRGGPEALLSLATTPTVSRDGSSTNMGNMATSPASEVVKRPQVTPRRPRPLSAHIPSKSSSTTPASEGKPPLHRKPKLSKEQEKSNRTKSMSVSPGRVTMSPSPLATKESSVDKDISVKKPSRDRSQVNPTEVSQKLEALQITTDPLNVTQENVTENTTDINQTPQSQIQQENNDDLTKTPENLPKINLQPATPLVKQDDNINETRKLIESEKIDAMPVEKQDGGRTDENEMTASMSARRITTEEEAKAALAERRRKAREEFERQAELERQRIEREAAEEAERQRLEEERQRREEQEARELAQLQRRNEEEKLRKAIEAQQQLEREEQERKAREEQERLIRLKEEEDKRKALEEEAKQKRLEAEKEEKERLLRKQRVEAIMARTRLKKAEEDKKQQQENKQQQGEVETPKDDSTESEQSNTVPVPATRAIESLVNNGNADRTGDLLGLGVTNNISEPKSENSSISSSIQSVETVVPANGNVADLLDLSEQRYSEDIKEFQQTNKTQSHTDNHTNQTPNNGNIGHISANFIQTEILSDQINQSVTPQKDKDRDIDKFEDDFTSHNGHNINHPLMQNAI